MTPKRARRLARAPLKIVGADTATGRRIIRLAEELDRLDPSRVLHDFARRIEAGRGAQPLPPRFERPGALAAPADLAPADDLLITEEPEPTEPVAPLPLPRPRPLALHLDSAFVELTRERLVSEPWWAAADRRREAQTRAVARTHFNPFDWRSR